MHRTIQTEDFERGLAGIPEDLRAPFRDYYLKGTPPGGLAGAMLAGSLFDTFDRAAGCNLSAEVPALVHFINDHLPYRAFGHPEKVRSWARGGGLMGRSPLGRKVA